MLRVLVIEKADTHAWSFKKVLETNGLTAHVVNSAEDGLRWLETECPDVVVMNADLPGMSGFQATRYLKSQAHTRSIPVFLLTNNGREGDEIWGLRQGAEAVFAHDVNEDEILNSIFSSVQPPDRTGSYNTALESNA